MICETAGCGRPAMPEREICARCIYADMAAKAAATPPPPGSRAMHDGDLGEAIKELT